MIKLLPTPTPLNPEIEIKLALSAWQAIFEQLTHGSCEEFAAILCAIAEQTGVQIEAAARAFAEPAAAPETQTNSTQTTTLN